MGKSRVQRTVNHSDVPFCLFTRVFYRDGRNDGFVDE